MDELRDLAQTFFPEPATQGPSAQGFLGVLGEALDNQTVLDRAAVKLRYTSGALMREVSARNGVEVLPTAGDAERLRRLGAAKGVARYESETDAQFEARIDSVIADARLLTTIAGLKRQLLAYGLPDVQIVEEWATPLGAPGSTFARRWTAVLGPRFGALGWVPLTLPFKLGTPTILGIAGATSAQISTVVRILLAWKTAASKPLAIVFRFGNFPVLGCGLKLPFKLGGSGGAAGSGYARRPVGENGALGKHALGGFKLGTAYTV